MSGNRRTIIVGTGSYIPTRTVHNEDFVPNELFSGYGEPLDPSNNGNVVEKFEDITNIVERRYVTDDLVASDIATFAAEHALTSSTIDRETLDYLIVAHNFGDVRADNPRSDFVPSLAARVKQKLAIHNPSCIAYDLPFGCPGWLQGVIQADYFLKSGDASRALVIGTETLSRVSDPHDRDSLLYSDGAGCAILEARESNEPAGVLSHAARSDTLEHAALMWMGASYNPNHDDHALYLKMLGRKLYEYAVTTVPSLVKESLDRAKLKLADVQKILMHQANARMNGMILKRNSSVATIPTILDLIVRGRLDDQELKTDDIVVFAAVGAGMNINSLIYRWP
jgi:3-oxoacyl-[acyl-carrier-protein] synthase-3